MDEKSVSSRRMKDFDFHFLAAALMVVIAAFLRLVPHPANFTPIGAMALFGGVHLMRRRWGLLLPLCALFLSDVVIGFHSQVFAVYASTLLVVLIGRSLGRLPSVGRITLGALTGSMVFFAITNFCVWMIDGLYPMTFEGLTMCYLAAIPFLKNEVMGTLFFSGVIFGAWEVVRRQIPTMEQAK